MTFPDLSEHRYEYQHASSVTNSVTNLYSMHLLVQELKPDGRVLKNIYDSQRRHESVATVGADPEPRMRNATFAYTNNFNLNSPTNLLTGVTAIYDYTNQRWCFYQQPHPQNGGPVAGNGAVRLAAKRIQRAASNAASSRTDKRGRSRLIYDSYGNITNECHQRSAGLQDQCHRVTSATYNTNNLRCRKSPTSGEQSQPRVYSSNFFSASVCRQSLRAATAVNTNWIGCVNITRMLSCWGSVR